MDSVVFHFNNGDRVETKARLISMIESELSSLNKGDILYRYYLSDYSLELFEIEYDWVEKGNVAARLGSPPRYSFVVDYHGTWGSDHFLFKVSKKVCDQLRCCVHFENGELMGGAGQ